MTRNDITPESLNAQTQPISALSKVIDGYLLATSLERGVVYLYKDDRIVVEIKTGFPLFGKHSWLTKDRND